MAELTDKSATLIGLGSSRGHAVVNKYSPLRRLNYFDGKFIRAPDLILEQQALLNQIRLGNRAGGAGVVYGYDCTLSGNDGLNIGAGYAIDPQGKALLLGDGISIGLGELIEKSISAAIRPGPVSASLSKATAAASFTPSSSFSNSLATSALQKTASSVAATSSAVTNSALKKVGFDDCVIHSDPTSFSASASDQLYLITLNHTEAYCGEEDVYGKLCSEACTTSTNRSYIIEGVEVRAVPINLSQLYKSSAALNLSAVHLRSRVASAYYEQERQLIASHISASGLSSSIWCLGAEASGGSGVPIAIIGRNGSTTLFLDAWTARRERMEAPPRHYWAGRMAMRPWQLFLAQILQFQCQLRGCLTSTDPSAPCKTLREFDPCAGTRKIASEAASGMRYLLDSLGRVAGQLSDLQALNINNLSLAEFQGGSAALEAQYQKLIDVARVVLPERLLINCGIVEVPSAGYLPVNASSTISVNEQVRRFFGEGVDLRFCVTRADYIPHALEEAQHMERICLLSGLDNPANKAKVDVLVPEGEIQQLEAQAAGSGYQSTTSISNNLLAIGWPRRVAAAADPAGSAASGLNISSSSLNTNLSAARLAEGLSVNVARSLPPLSGAARGEQLESGGVAFYLAARSTTSFTSSGSLTLANAASNSVLSLLNEGRSTAGLTASSGLRSNINVSANIDTLAAATRVPTLAPSTALWASLKTSRDPFTLATGDSCDVQAQFILVSSRLVGNSNQTLVSERSINGQLQIQKGAPQAGLTKLSARLLASGIWSDTTITNGQSQERTEAVKLNESLVISRRPVAGLPPTLNFSISNPSFFAGLGNIQLVAERIWTSPTNSTFRLLLRRQDIRTATLARADALVAADTGVLINRATDLQAFDPASNDDVLLDCKLNEDSNVLQAGNSWHSNSLQALSTLEKATGDKGFSDSAQQRLFPPPLPVADELRILARLPWVLFHRRRDKICQPAVAAATVLVARHYRVYHVHLDANVNVEQLLASLQRDVGGTLASLKPLPVTTVEFAPGIALVATAQGDVRADWQARVQVTADIQLALIASEGEVISEGEALADSRLQSLTNVLDPVSELAEGFQTLSVNEVPDTLAGAEVDGIIVYFTRSVATVCHAVYRVLSNNVGGFIEALGGYLGNAGGESLPSYIQRRGGQVLAANPRFFTNGDSFFGASEAAQLDASWDVLNDGPVSNVVTLGADETAAQQVVSRQQASRISQTVGTAISADSVQYLAAGANLLKPCPKATVLIAATQCNDVYFYTPPVSELPPLVKQLQEFIQDRGLSREIINSGVNTGATRVNLFTRFRAVDFYAASDQFETGSRDSYSLAWQSELGGNSPASLNAVFMCIARTGATAAETEANLKLAQEQGLKLRNLMGLGQLQVVGAVNSTEVDFPVDCQVLTLLVVARAANFGLLDTTNFAAVTTSVNRQPSADSGSSGDDNSVAGQPELTVELANGVRFNNNNEVIRDAAFTAAVGRALERETPIDTIEVISVDATPDPAAEARANALLTALRESGAASGSASVSVRTANERERAEIVRSGFVLNRGIVLR